MLKISTLWGRNDDSLSCTTLAKRVTGKLLFATEYPGNRRLATFPVVSLEKRERNGDRRFIFYGTFHVAWKFLLPGCNTSSMVKDW